MTAARKPVVEVSGAGPAGLAAALAVTAAGQHALVYEKHADVGTRFHGDFQGLENWTTREDVLEELASLGINTDFEHVPIREVVGFDPAGVMKIVRSAQPLFYLVRRGAQPGSLDYALKEQALAAGVEIRFRSPASHLPNGGVVSEGPRRADAIVAGYLFDTDMADGIYLAVSDELAPKGYAYLLINQGRGTVATCLFVDFHNERRYLERSIDFFDNQVGLRMYNQRRFGGGGNFSLPRTARKGNILYAGEAAGFQDPLFGFGIRWALLSGAAAGRALATGNPGQYDQVWKRRMRPYQQTAATNRWIYERLGNRGYSFALRQFPKDGDGRDRLHRSYTPRWWKRGWYHITASGRVKPLLKLRTDCDCTWCRCERHLNP